MNQHLSKDEFDALEEISRASKGAKYSACVGRNSKRLVGIKFLAHRKDGSFQLTEKGTEAMFVKKCIAALRALASDPAVRVEDKVGNFLGRKGYAVAATGGQFEITQRGRDCLADIDLNAGK
ncbi:MAG: hypothetical protein ABI905_09710 [Betaproteobacteria bacterium]